MLTSDRPIITDTAIESLQHAAEELQAHYLHEEGHCYPLDDLMGALVAWVESTVEEMSSDALFHCIEGRDDFAFNRRGFLNAMKKLSTNHATI